MFSQRNDPSPSPNSPSRPSNLKRGSPIKEPIATVWIGLFASFSLPRRLWNSCDVGWCSVWVLGGSCCALSAFALLRRCVNAGRPARYRVRTVAPRYRMHPSIRSFPSSQFYESKLEDQVCIPHRVELNCIWPDAKECRMVWSGLGEPHRWVIASPMLMDFT